MNKSHLKIILILILSFYLFGAKISKKGEVLDVIGRIVEHNGEIYINNNETITPFNVMDKYVYGKQQIITKKGKCKIVLTDKSEIVVNKGTIVSINEGKKSINVNTYIGELFFKIKPQKTGIKVNFKTSKAVCGIRGTEGKVVVDVDGEAEFALATGHATIYDQSGKEALIDIKEHEQTKFNKNNELEPIRKYIPEKPPEIKFGEEIVLAKRVKNSTVFKTVDSIIEISKLSKNNDLTKSIKDNFLATTTKIKNKLVSLNKKDDVKHLENEQAAILESLNKVDETVGQTALDYTKSLQENFNLIMQGKYAEAEENNKTIKKEYIDKTAKDIQNVAEIRETFGKSLLKVIDITKKNIELDKHPDIQLALLKSLNKAIDISVESENVEQTERLYVPFEDIIKDISKQEDKQENKQLLKALKLKKEKINNYIIYEKSRSRSFQDFSW